MEPALAECMAHRVRMSADHVSKRFGLLIDMKAIIRKSVMGMTSKYDERSAFVIKLPIATVPHRELTYHSPYVV